MGLGFEVVGKKGILVEELVYVEVRGYEFEAGFWDFLLIWVILSERFR